MLLAADALLTSISAARWVRRACSWSDGSHCQDKPGRCAHLLIELVGEARHAAAHALILFCLRVPGRQQEGTEPLDLAALPMPGADDDQVQGVPQPLAVVPANELAAGAQELTPTELFFGSDAQLQWHPPCTRQTHSIKSHVQGLQLEALQAAAGARLKQQVQHVVLRGPGSQQTPAVGPEDSDLQALKERAPVLDTQTLQPVCGCRACFEGLHIGQALLLGRRQALMPSMRTS